MKHLRLFSYIFLVSIFITFSSQAQGIKDIIRPIHLTAGVTDTILVSDIFYAKDYAVQFYSDKFINALYKPREKKLYLTSKADYEGVRLLRFKYLSGIYYIPVISSIKQEHTFEYKTHRKTNNVNLLGSFNNWNREDLPMQKTGSGIYKVTVPLDPGSYEYKFDVDGREILDPANKDSAANRLGGFNSVITVKPLHHEKAFLHMIGKTVTDTGVTVSFYYEREKQTGPLTYPDIIALDNNYKLPYDRIFIDSNKINLFFNGVLLDRDEIIRIIVSQNGVNTNMQTFHLYHGVPVSDSKVFTWHNGVIYSVLIDRFFDGDKSNSKPVKSDKLSFKTNYQGGDLQGVIDKINSGYFNKLGVNTLWLSPVVDNTDSVYREHKKPHKYFSGYHGFWPVSSTKVEERFGNITLLKKLVGDAHKRGIKVLLDYVANHVLIEHPFRKEHPDWFVKLELPGGERNLRMHNKHGLTNGFEPYMLKFDYLNSQAALDTMTSNAVWWIKETGADGFVFNEVDHIPNIFWRTLTAKLKREIEIPENKKLFQIGITTGNYKLVNSYINAGQLNAQFNFNLYNTALPVFLEKNVSFKFLNNELEKSFAVYGNNNLMGNIIDNYNKVRFIAYADGDVPLSSDNAVEIGWKNPPKVDKQSSYKKETLYLAFNLTIPGVPVINYGDEIGMTGAAEPDNRRMMRFDDDLINAERNTLHEITNLIHIRNNHSALRYGDFYALQANVDDYVYLRSDLNEHILVVLNKSNQSKNIEINLPSFFYFKNGTDLIKDKSFKIIGNKLSLNLPAISYQIIKLN